MIDLCINFFSIWARFCEPSWIHVGHFFATRRPQDPPKKHQKLMPTLKTAQTRPGSLQTSILVPPDLDFAPPDLDVGATRPRFLNDLGLLLSYLATLLHCYLVTLLHCYLIAFLLCSWRGGGVAALLHCWIICHCWSLPFFGLR